MSRVLERAYTTLDDSSAPSEMSRALHAAFAAYDSIRRPRAQRQVETSVDCGLLYNLSHSEAGHGMQKTVDNLNRRFDWLWNHDLDEDADKAVRRCDEIIGSQIRELIIAKDLLLLDILTLPYCKDSPGAGSTWTSSRKNNAVRKLD